MNDKIIEIMKLNLLTPVIYLLDEEILTVVGFFDGQTQMNQLYQTQQKLETALKTEVNICDIRDFTEADRIDIIKNGDLIFCETPLVKSLFETAMYEDYKMSESKRIDTIERNKKSGTVFLS